MTTDLSKKVLNDNLDDFYTSVCHSCELRVDHLKKIKRKVEAKSELEALIKKIDENQISQQTNFEK